MSEKAGRRKVSARVVSRQLNTESARNTESTRSTESSRNTESSRSGDRPSERSLSSGLTEKTQASRPLGNGLSFGFPSLLLLAVGLALCLRLVHVLQTSTVPTVLQLVGDAQGYYVWAMRITDGNWYGDETFYQAPLYPYFLAVVFKLSGPSILGLRLIQAVLGATSVALLGVAAKNAFDWKAGVATAFGLAIYPAAIYYDGLVQKAALASFLLAAFLCAVSYLPLRFRIAPAITAGCLLGLLVLTRENALLWLPILPLWILVGFQNETIKRRLLIAGGYGFGVGLILIPVAARNASLGGEWSPTTFQSGPNFYIGNNLEATGVYKPLVAGHETPEFERADAERLAEQDMGQTLSAREVSRFWTRRTLTDVAADPVRWGWLMIAKVGMVVNRYEVPDVESLYVHRQWSVPLAVFSRVWHFGILAPLAVLGFFVVQPDLRLPRLFLVLAITMVFAVALFFILGRYRLPLVLLLMPFAAVALVRFRELAQISGKKRVVVGAAFIVALLISNAPLHDERGLNASSYMNVGIAAGKAGDLPTCVRWLTLAVQLRPESAVGHYNLAGAQVMLGLPAEAITSLRRAKQIDPSLVEVDRTLAQLLEQVGRPQEALIHYQNALTIDPSDVASAMAIDRLQARE